jgi:hypothetical protein
LATTDDARVHCAVLKIRAVPILLTQALNEKVSVRAEVRLSGRSLRTQQRARPAQPSNRRSVPQAAVLTCPS